MAWILPSTNDGQDDPNRIQRKYEYEKFAKSLFEHRLKGKLDTDRYVLNHSRRRIQRLTDDWYTLTGGLDGAIAWTLTSLIGTESTHLAMGGVFRTCRGGT